MRLQLIICKVLQREAYYCAARSSNIVDVVLMEQGLHTEPEKLRSQLSKTLAKTSDIQGNPYDASLLGYGLCGKGTVGLSATIPLVIPRAHDCITLLLGSKERYKSYFESNSGTYWYSPGWIETGTQPGSERSENLYEVFRKKYNDEKARYLVEIEKEWTKKYNKAVYIDWGLGNTGSYKQYTKNSAKSLGWNYEELKGDPGLMQRFLDGCWQENEFLILNPGQKISEDINDEGIIKVE
jgi:hypothetical protein